MLSIPRLSLADARILIEGAALHSEEIGVPMCIAVTDESGNMIAFQRMDGAKVLSVGLAADKAYTAAISRRPTHEYNKLCVPGSLVNGINTYDGGRFSTVGGGYPVIIDGDTVGGIGCSSGTVEQDMACASAGLELFLVEES